MMHSPKRLYPDARVTPGVLWFDGCHSLSWVDEMFGRSRLHAPVLEVPFLALLRACAKNKDLQGGASLHDELSRSGLLENFCDALVSMYARCGALSKARELFDTFNCRDVFAWTALIAGYADNGMPHDALCIFEQLQHAGLSPNATTFACILKACGSIRAIEHGEKIHDAISKEGLLANNLKLGTALLGMYVKCGALSKAHKVLEELPVRDAIAWNALISGYAENSKGEEALNCFEEMQQEGLAPDAITLACTLRACGSMGAAHKGEKIYIEYAKEGFLRDNIALGNALLDMYGKCGALVKARQVLRELPVRNVLSWNTLMVGYAKHGECEEALNCFEQMQHEGIYPDAISFACALKACASTGAVERGKKLHNEIKKQGLLRSNTKLGTALVDMYAKCGAFTKAHQVLEELPVRAVIPWNALIAGYVEHDKGDQALNCLEHMQYEGLNPDGVTFMCAVKACGITGAMDKGAKLHDEITKQGYLANNDGLGNALVGMYAKCGALAKARQVLKGLPTQSVISWNAIIGGHADQGEGEQALHCFEQMQHENLSPDVVTFVSVLKACGSIGAVDKGERFHELILQQKLVENHSQLGNALVDMYAKCGAFAKALQVLEDLEIRDVAAWNALIAGYVEHGEGKQALNCFERMQQEGLCPDSVTCLCILKACGGLGNAACGEEVHNLIALKGWLENNIVLGTALLYMYAMSGALSKAQYILEKLCVRNAMSWNALIGGYVKHGDDDHALVCYEKMQQENISPDPATMSSILKACGSIGAIEKGQKIHEKIVNQGLLGDNVVLSTALVDMYARCDALPKAHLLLEELPVQNVVSWNALITGYVEHGKCKQALRCFQQMQREGFSPDAVTFICLLKAYGSLGATDEGEKIHDKIVKHGLLGKNVVLDTALVDMYGKCGALAKARRLLEELSVKSVGPWSALISRYCEHEQGEQALSCFEQMRRKGICPNSVTFISVLKACGSIGAVDMGKKIHDEIAEQGLLNDNIVLSTALLDMYAKCNVLSKARQVLEDSSARDVISWNALIAGLIRKGEVVQAFYCFQKMCQEGMSPDVATFSSVLNACSRLGLVDDAQAFFRNMDTKYGITPDLEHYACMIDVFGRAGHLDKAAGVIEKLPSNSGVWSTLLGACEKWGDANVGRWAFEHALKVNNSDPAIYVLMANTYAAAGLPDDAKEWLRLKIEALIKPAHSWWHDKKENVYRLHAGDIKHAQISQFHMKLKDFPQKMNTLPNSSLGLFCAHCENLALAFDLINTPEQSTNVKLNRPTFGECHVATLLISEVEKRGLSAQESKHQDVFQYGKCLCGYGDTGALIINTGMFMI